MGKIKIKHRNPKRTEFTPNDIVINVKNGTLFYKSNFAIFRLQGVQTTLINPAADTVSVNIEQAEHQQVLFNNNNIFRFKLEYSFIHHRRFIDYSSYVWVRHCAMFMA